MMGEILGVVNPADANCVAHVDQPIVPPTTMAMAILGTQCGPFSLDSRQHLFGV